MMMKTPAMMNQYGETCTGMPNGLATTKLFWCGPRPRRSGCSSWPLATIPMLRAFGRELVTGAGARGIGLGCGMSVGRPTVASVDVENVVDSRVDVAIDTGNGAGFGGAGDPPSALSPSLAGGFMT